MKYTFTEKKVNISDDLKAYAEKKIAKLDKFFRGDSEAFVTFCIERGMHRAEVTVKNNGMFYRASETTSDMYVSVDSAVASIERQIRKNKTRLEKKLRSGTWETEAVPVYETEPEETEEETEFEIFRTKRFPLKPMTADEAILQMNLLGHNFFAFRDVDNNDTFAVVYKRNQRGYGLIEEDEKSAAE